jgi:hypothetical protein
MIGHHVLDFFSHAGDLHGSSLHLERVPRHVCHSVLKRCPRHHHSCRHLNRAPSLADGPEPTRGTLPISDIRSELRVHSSGYTGSSLLSPQVSKMKDRRNTCKHAHILQGPVWSCCDRRSAAPFSSLFAAQSPARCMLRDPETAA